MWRKTSFGTILPNDSEILAYDITLTPADLLDIPGMLLKGYERAVETPKPPFDPATQVVKMACPKVIDGVFREVWYVDNLPVSPYDVISGTYTPPD